MLNYANNILKIVVEYLPLQWTQRSRL